MSLKKYRKEIDEIDKKILSLLEKRFIVSKKIGFFKKENNLKIYDKKREKEIINKKINNTNLPKNFIKKLYKLIFKESRKVQK